MKKTQFYDLHVKAGATMGTGLWSTPQKYTSPVEEHNAVRNTVGITDFSTMGKFDIKGEDAKKFVQKMIVNDVNKLSPGKVIYSCMTNVNGGIYDDTTVYCFNEEHYWIVGSTAGREKDAIRFKQYSKDMRVYITDMTSAFGLLTIQGPNSRDLINSICTPSLDDVKYFRFKEIKIGSCTVLASRTGFTGELGFELYILTEDCSDVWEMISEAGESFDAKYCGMMAAGGTLPLEKGYIGGKDYGEHTNPYEVGLGWTVCLDTDFIGRDALCKVKEKGPKSKLTGFQIGDKSKVATSGAEVLINGKVVGKVTSTALSVTYGVSFGMALIDSNNSKYGTKIQIRFGDNLVDAVLTPKTLHDPEGKRLTV